MKVENITCILNKIKILDSISFEIEPGKVLGIIGASGSGKTTLLKCITGINPIEEGSITVNGYTLRKDFKKRQPDVYWKFRRHVGVVFQHLYLFPHLTALGNVVEAPVQVDAVPKESALKNAADLLSKVGLGDSLDKYPDELSGGEQQRVAIIRSLIMNPNLLLLDEPTSALDPKRSIAIRTLLKNYVNEGQTLLIVSHSIKFLQGLADEIIFMDKGRIIESGPTEELLNNPKHEKTKEFLRHV